MTSGCAARTISPEVVIWKWCIAAINTDVDGVVREMLWYNQYQIWKKALVQIGRLYFECQRQPRLGANAVEQTKIFW
jgi:hypothetical protein